MFNREDNTFDELREKSVLNWLEELKDHEDIVVRGGVKVTGEYIESLKNKIQALEKKNQVKEEYLKKMKLKGSH